MYLSIYKGSSKLQYRALNTQKKYKVLFSFKGKQAAIIYYKNHLIDRHNNNNNNITERHTKFQLTDTPTVSK